MASAARFALLLSLAGSVRSESEVETDAMCALQAGRVKVHDGLGTTIGLLYEKDHNIGIYNPAQDPDAFAAGAAIVWSNSVSDAKGSLAGLSQGVLFYSTPFSSVAQFTLILEGGTIMMVGPYNDSAPTSTLAVTGGSGRFKGAWGSMLSGAINDAVGEYYWSYAFTLSLHAPPCVPLPAHSFSLSPPALVQGYADKGMHGESPGDIHTMAGPAVDAAGERAADVHIFCATLAGRQQDCLISVVLASGDLLVAQGAWYDSPANQSDILITGGTGAKQGAKGTLQLRKRSDGGLDFVVGGSVLPPAPPREHHPSEHLALFEPFNDVDTPALPGQSALPGDLQTWSSTLEDQKTKAVLGQDSGYCVRTNATTFQCLYVLSLKDGLLTVQGLSFQDRPGGPIAVTGGTGKYAGAAGGGTASTVPGAEGQQPLGFSYTLNVVLRKGGL